MSDLVRIRGLRVTCHVGVPDDERASAQPLSIDLDLVVDLSAASVSDDVADTVDYGVVTTAVAAAVTAAPIALLERVAGIAADVALGVDERTEAVTVTVTKLRPPIPVDVDTTSVVLHRSR